MAVAVAALWVAASPVGARDKDRAPSDGEGPRLFQEENRRPRHAGEYPRFAVAWRPVAFGKRIFLVAAHPLLDRRVVIAAADGLYVSEDAGKAWAPLPSASREKIGEVTAVEFSPNRPGTYYIATLERGVWATDDNGKTFRQIGSKATGLAADEAVDVCVFRGDRRLKTLLVGHGAEAPGLSCSMDGGRTWDVLHRDYHVHRIGPGLPYGHYTNLFVVASPRDRPEIRNVYHCEALGDHWQAVAGDLIVTDLGVPRLNQGWGTWRGRPVYFATADVGVFGISKTEVMRLGPEENSRCASIAATWARTADTEMIILYETARLGMVVSTDSLKTWTNSVGPLPVGPFVRQGAHIRPNASATVFYAVANGRLFRGEAYTGPHTISALAVEPPVVRLEVGRLAEASAAFETELEQFRRRRRLSGGASLLLEQLRAFREVSSASLVIVSARVSGNAPPAAVTVDASRLGGSTRTPMLDDGLHDDGEAGDGLFAASVAIASRAVHSRGSDWRQSRGPVGLTVTAVGEDGRLSGAVAALGLYDVPSSFGLFGPEEEREVEVAGRPWQVAFGGDARDLAGQVAMAFDLRADPPTAGKALRVRLRDAPPFSMPAETRPVALLQEGYVPGGEVPSEYVRVVVPVRRLLREADDFMPTRFSRVIFSGEGGFEGSYWIRNLRFEVAPDILDDEHGGSKP